MNKILVLGSTGMLGQYVTRYLKNKSVPVTASSRIDFDASNPTQSEIENLISPFNVIINCIGLIKPQVDKYGIVEAIRINSVFPHQLANTCESKNKKLIHITTDCVYSGKIGGYTETSISDVSDTYGKTKSMGEPQNCTTIRTSIIGEEVHQQRSLIEWAKSQNGKTVHGYTNHI